VASITSHHLVAQMLAHTAQRTRPTDTPYAPPALAGDTTTAISLGSPVELPPRALADVIKRRRSGNIVQSNIRKEQLAALLSAWHAELPSCLLPDPSFHTLAFPVALTVDELPPAVYRYDGATCRLFHIGPATPEALRKDILLQWEHGSAAALIFLVVPLSRWLHRCGDRGYRSLALQAGWITDRLYLIAEALGLSYTASGGYAPACADRLLCLDGYHYTAFFSFVVGGARR